MSILSNAKPLSGAALPFAAGVFGLWMLTSLLLDIVAAKDAVAWPIADGVVLSSKAQKGCGKGASFFPSVLYRYSVNSQQYEGRRIAFGNCGCGSESSAAAIAGQYPEGTAVMVHFNPSSHSNAVLIVGTVLDETWIGVAVTAIMSIVSFGLAYTLAKAARSNLSLQGTLRDKAAQRP